MDVSAACDVTFPEFLESRYKYDLKQPCSNHRQCFGTVDVNADSVVAELGNALTDMLHAQDVQVQLTSQISPSDGEKMCHQEEIKIHDNEHLNAPTYKCLNKSATFPCSKNTPSCLGAVDESNDIFDTTLDEESSAVCKVPVCVRSISLPTHSELVSALKGSREKQGIPLMKLSVKWSPDVYDPPTSSVSHSVKSRNHHHRAKNKKSGKHKHKGKNSRGSHNEKHYCKHVGSTNSQVIVKRL